MTRPGRTSPLLCVPGMAGGVHLLFHGTASVVGVTDPSPFSGVPGSYSPSEKQVPANHSVCQSEPDLKNRFFDSRVFW